MSPVFAGGFFTTEPPGKTCSFSFQSDSVILSTGSGVGSGFKF